MDKQTAKLIARISENLPDMDGNVMQGWIDNPRGLKKFLSNLCPPASATTDLKVWKTLKLGTGLKTADDFRKAIKAAGMKIGDWGNDILGKPAFTASETAMDVELVNVSVAELGFEDGATLLDIQAKADKLGLDPCPAEVGPQLRLQYADQPKGEWLIVAMKPIAGSDGSLSVFVVGRDDVGRWLDGDDGDPGDFWDGFGRFVFVRRK